MKLPLPPDVEFHEDIRLLVYRPRGLVNKTAVNKIITVIGELEFTLKEPFNRFSDTVGADAVDLNFEYIISVSLYRRRFYGNRPPIKSDRYLFNKAREESSRFQRALGARVGKS